MTSSSKFQTTAKTNSLLCCFFSLFCSLNFGRVSVKFILMSINCDITLLLWKKIYLKFNSVIQILKTEEQHTIQHDERWLLSVDCVLLGNLFKILVKFYYCIERLMIMLVDHRNISNIRLYYQGLLYLMIINPRL